MDIVEKLQERIDLSKASAFCDMPTCVEEMEEAIKEIKRLRSALEVIATLTHSECLDAPGRASYALIT